jgi:hypothetical protein
MYAVFFLAHHDVWIEDWAIFASEPWSIQFLTQIHGMLGKAGHCRSTSLSFYPKKKKKKKTLNAPPLDFGLHNLLWTPPRSFKIKLKIALKVSCLGQLCYKESPFGTTWRQLNNRTGAIVRQADVYLSARNKIRELCV